MLKQCSKCRRDLPLPAFNSDGSRIDGLRYVCRECQHKECQYYYQRELRGRDYAERRLALARYRSTHVEEERVRHMVRNAVARGKLGRPDACERCGGEEPLQGHHGDYSKPMAVEWLCDACHRLEHRGAINVVR